MPINDWRQLAEPFRDAVGAWLEAGGGRFYVNSGIRTRQEQIDLRRAHCGSSDYAIYSMPASQCHPATAIPGTSRHEIGQAVDVAGDRDLAARLAPQFGLGRTVPSESWHFECVNEALAATFPRKLFTVSEIDRIVAKLDEAIAVTQRQGELTRKQIRRQALLVRQQEAKHAKAAQRDLDAIQDELQQMGPEEAEG